MTKLAEAVSRANSVVKPPVIRNFAVNADVAGAACCYIPVDYFLTSCSPDFRSFEIDQNLGGKEHYSLTHSLAMLLWLTQL
jgi:hypothetical protein